MNIKIENKNGGELRIGSRSDCLCLTDMPDFGNVPYIFSSSKIPMLDGEVFHGGRLGVRDIIIRFEARGEAASRVYRVLAPGSELRIYIDSRWYIDGVANGIVKAERPYPVIPLQMTLAVRCFDPYFYRVGGACSAGFDNKANHLYGEGGYLYQRFEVNNPGDVSCPMEMELKVYDGLSGVAGVFTSALWNQGNPSYEGFKVKGPVSGQDIYVNTDIPGNHAGWYGDFFNPSPLWLKPGKNVFYALNCKGEIRIKPRFLSIEEGLCKDRY